ncbi:hypothetical protein L3X38_011467 [Prunus dulcis]|uniref:Retrotransposon Copia-like N-terminal domain-containing protein n=1 Tax=Prunus dulcis TaxID=3755 RepID=A0AAD4WJW9_PRUDU|nr:hypothetical protein L3X38_011467 [Prunus dulcis]
MTNTEERSITPKTQKPINQETNSIPDYAVSLLLHLHHLDNPGTIIVSKPLIGDNYPTWSRAIGRALEAKNKLGFIDESLTMAAKASPNYDQWICCNSMVNAWIVDSLSA